MAEYIYQINDLGRFYSEEKAVKKATEHLMADPDDTLKVIHRAKIYFDCPVLFFDPYLLVLKKDQEILTRPAS